MLRRNIDIELGLVNGATGTLKDIDMDQTGRVRSLWIRFDGHRSVTKVLRVRLFLLIIVLILSYDLFILLLFEEKHLSSPNVVQLQLLMPRPVVIQDWILNYSRPY